MALVPAICTQCGAKLEVDWGDYQYLFEILSIDGDIVKTSPYLNCNKYFDNYYPVKRVDFNVFPYMRIVSLDIKNCKVVIEFNNQRFDLFKDKNCFEYDPIEFIGSEAAVQLYFDYRENYLTRCSNIEFEEGVDKNKYIDYLEKRILKSWGNIVMMRC